MRATCQEIKNSINFQKVWVFGEKLPSQVCVCENARDFPPPFSAIFKRLFRVCVMSLCCICFFFFFARFITLHFKKLATITHMTKSANKKEGKEMQRKCVVGAQGKAGRERSRESNDMRVAKRERSPKLQNCIFVVCFFCYSVSISSFLFHFDDDFHQKFTFFLLGSPKAFYLYFFLVK